MTKAAFLQTSLRFSEAYKRRVIIAMLCAVAILLAASIVAQSFRAYWYVRIVYSCSMALSLVGLILYLMLLRSRMQHAFGLRCDYCRRAYGFRLERTGREGRCPRCRSSVWTDEANAKSVTE